MNERIQELASQSNFNWFLSSGNLSTNNTIHDLEKFAELIIQECVKQVEKDIPKHPSTDFEQGAKWAFEEAASEIKLYFGVSV